MNKKIKTKILNELKDLLNEQNQTTSNGPEYDDSDLGPVVDELVDLLDGYVTSSNIQEILQIINKYRGKTAIDQTDPDESKEVPALKRIAELYKLDESGDSLYDDIKNIGLSSISREGQIAHNHILKILERETAKEFSATPAETDNSQTQATNADSAQKEQPGVFKYSSGKQGKNSFMCVDQLSVGIFQQWLRYAKKQNIPVDCKIGPKTIQASNAVGKTSTPLSSYFIPDIASKDAETIAKITKIQHNFCAGIKNNIEGYKKEIIAAGQTPISKCGMATSKRPAKKTISKTPIDNTENNTALETPQGQKKSNKQGMVPMAEGLLDFTDKKKLNEAKKLFGKLLKRLKG